MLDSSYKQSKILFWILNVNVAYSIWPKQEKVSFSALSYGKEDLCDDGISGKNSRCNSRIKVSSHPTPSPPPSFFLILSLSLIFLGLNSGIGLGLHTEK